MRRREGLAWLANGWRGETLLPASRPERRRSCLAKQPCSWAGSGVCAGLNRPFAERTASATLLRAAARVWSALLGARPVAVGQRRILFGIAVAALRQAGAFTWRGGVDLSGAQLGA